jgi:hypothetical protein
MKKPYGILSGPAPATRMRTVLPGRKAERELADHVEPPSAEPTRAAEEEPNS